ncbi:leucine-rich repeat domain-containing protein [Bremerella sp.]|uniref:leucine-rich repeat domain-containing protein n=1 Tax=Bremerella sp. TaxID=2795602 RepID=UPI00391C465C
MTETKQTGKKPRRRWLSFGLRSFFVVLTLLCIFLGWIGTAWMESRREAAAVEKIMAAGGAIGYDYEAPAYYMLGDPENEPAGHPVIRSLFGEHIFSRVEAIEFGFGLPAQPNDVAQELGNLQSLREISFRGNNTLENSIVETLRDLPQLRSLAFFQRSISPEQMKILAQSNSIEELHLCDQNASDEHLKQLQYFPNLKSLSIRSSLPTDAGIQSLGNASSLTSLHIYSAHKLTNECLKGLTKLKQLKEFTGPTDWSRTLTDDCLPTLCQIPSLESISISINGIFEEDVPFDIAQYQSFERMTNLKKLELWGSNIQDEAMPVIGKLTRLEELHLSGNSITDEGLASLTNLHRLEVLSLSSDEITNAGLQQLEHLKSIHTLDVTIGQGVSEEYLRSQGYRFNEDIGYSYIRPSTAGTAPDSSQDLPTASE